MFSILNIKPEESNFFKRLKNRLYPPNPKMERINIVGAAPFYTLEIYENQCGENYENVAKLLGPSARAVILPKGVSIKNTRNLQLFRPTVFPNLMTVNCAEEYLKKIVADNRTVLGIRDIRGTFASHTERFVNFAGEIRVYSKNETVYGKISDFLYTKYGLSLIISPNENVLKKCDLIVSPDNDFNRLFNNAVLVKKSENRWDVLKGEGVCLDEKYSRLCPEGIDALAFAGALYETCAVKELQLTKYEKLNSVYENVLVFGEN